MGLGKKPRTEGSTELTPAVMESVALEIVQNAMDVLELYEIKGSVVSLGLGFTPSDKKIKELGKKDYKLSLNNDPEFALVVNYKYKDGKKGK